jgi:hypothetical protein
MIIVYDCMKLKDIECVCEEGTSLCVETHKRFCRFKKTHDGAFSNVSKVQCVL